MQYDFWASVLVIASNKQQTIDSESICYYLVIISNTLIFFKWSNQIILHPIMIDKSNENTVKAIEAPILVT